MFNLDSNYRLMILLTLLLQGILSFGQSEVKHKEDLQSSLLLYNGTEYNFVPPVNTKGTPFLFEDACSDGVVVIRGEGYTNLKLNYDIYNQKIVLYYKNNQGAEQAISLSEAWLESIRLGQSTFAPVNLGDSTLVFCQVIGNGPCKLAYRWQKYLLFDGNSTNRQYLFTKAHFTKYLCVNDICLKYRNNHQLIKLLEPDVKTLVHNFIRHNKINVKRSDDAQMLNMINYLNSLKP